MLTENSSGKSGSFFFYTSDSKFMIKTIKKSEFHCLLRILKSYYSYLTRNPNSKITRYFGLHQIKCYGKKGLIYDIYVTVMNNVFDVENLD